MNTKAFIFALGLVVGLVDDRLLGDRHGAWAQTVVYVHAGELRKGDASGTRELVTRLPADAAGPLRIEATRDGGLLVFDLGSSSAWLVVESGTKPGTWHSGVCHGRARPSPGGECLVCGGNGAPPVLMSITGEVARPLPAPLAHPNFVGPKGEQVAGLSADGVVAFDVKKPGAPRLLAKPGARTHLLVAPSGMVAVAVFGEKEGARIYSFFLDGQGVPRRLGGPGVPVVWSWDSQWILVQEGIVDEKDDEKDEEDDDDPGEVGPSESSLGQGLNLVLAPATRRKRPTRPPPPPPLPKTRACVIRAIGGETKCWAGYEALAFSPDSSLVLLKKDQALYVGTIAGVRAIPPRKILEPVDGPATWIP